MATAPRHPHHARHPHHPAVQAAPGVNAGLAMSAAGRAALAAREGQGGQPGNRGGHYNDSTNNCTVGTGTLVHTGPCTAAELAARADQRANANDLDTRIRTAEGVVRRGVNTRPLNQNQFDALVSAAYNSGTAIGGALAQANNDDDVAVTTRLRAIVMVHQHDGQGHVVRPATVSQGLVNRRAGEINQYNTPVAPPPGPHR